MMKMDIQHQERNKTLASNGFTLVELLVVIAIISILIAMIVPVVTKARESARMSGCSSNMKSIAQALFLYAGSNNGMLPPLRSHTVFDSINKPNTWAEKICPSLGIDVFPVAESWRGRNTVFVCPSDRTSIAAYIKANYHIGKNSYAGNCALMDLPDVDTNNDGRFGGRSLAGLKSSSTTILLNETHRDNSSIGTSACYRPEAFTFYAYTGGAYGIAPEIDPARVGFHRGLKGNNWCFADGHVEFMNFSETYSDAIDLWNL